MSNTQSHRIPEEVKIFIIGQKQQKVAPKDIIPEVKKRYKRNITHASIRRIWKKFQETKSTRDRSRSGRPKSLTSREERAIVRRCLTEPGTSVHSIVRERTRAGTPITRPTVRKALRRSGLVPRTSNRGKEISARNIAKRLGWATIFRHWTILEWRLIVFTDESQLYPKRTATKVIWHKKGQTPPHDEEPNLQYKSINVWGFISHDGNRGLVRFWGTLDADVYLQILDIKLRKAVPREADRDEELYFMQDGAPSHTANITKDYLKDKADIFPWPPQSPDLNLVENIWAYVRNELWNRRLEIRNSDDTWRLSQQIFNNISIDFIRKLYESLPRRLELVIEANGDRIDY